MKAELVRLLAMGSLLVATQVAAADFYAGKTITLLVGASAGGGYDTYSRTIARHLTNHIPGKPVVVARNQPGAGSATAAAAIFNTAPKDGTWIGNVFPGVLMEPLLDPKPKNLFDPKAFKYIGSADSSVRLCVTGRGSKVETFLDAQNMKAIMGDAAGGGSTRDYVNMLVHTAGAKFQIVSGYPGTAEIFLAIERNEVDGVCGLDWSSLRAQRPDWIKDGTVNFLVQAGLTGDPGLTKQGVPMMWDFIKNDDDRIAAELVVGQQAFGRPYIAPPETPRAQVEILRSGLARTLQDPALLADAAKAGLSINPTSGEEVQALIERIYSSSDSAIERAKKIIRQ